MRFASALALAALLTACSRDNIGIQLDDDADADGFTVLTDCNDADPNVFPGAEERCNDIDDDCSGVVDDNAVDAPIWYVDLDGDGAPGTETAPSCAQPSNAFDAGTDCDDTNASVNPEALEVCNDLDDDCDGLVDTDDDDVDVATSRDVWPDADADGFGDVGGTVELACETPDGFADNGDDCNDGDALVNPDAREVCDSVDNDCNQLSDDDDPTLWLASTSTFYVDRDGDGFGGAFFEVRACEQPDGTTDTASDCDDVDILVHPDATEICNNRDDNCDGDIDDADAAVDLSTGFDWYADVDNDGFGDAAGSAVRACAAPAAHAADNTDCNDDNDAVRPGVAEVCNGIDDNCNTRTDDDDPALDTATATRFWSDRDDDGHGGVWFSLVACEQPDGMSATSDDCDDDNDAVSPSAPEVCNGVDDNCNDEVDDDDAGLDGTTGTVWYADLDNDGWGSGTDTTSACVAPAGYGTDNDDCDDDDDAIYPGATEICNGVDDNCDTQVDDADDDLVADNASYWLDDDGDGYGVPDVWACEDFGFGWANELGDCNDNDGTIHPGADERCNGVDDNCNTATDEDPIDGATFFEDVDGDQYGSEVSVQACFAGPGFAVRDGDCDDARSDVNPDAIERCDTVDNNCNDIVDLDTPNLPQWYVDDDGDQYGLSGTGVPACLAFDDRVSVDGDCDDTNENVSPGTAEIDNDDLDNDCNGIVDVPGTLPGGLIDADTTWGDAYDPNNPVPSAFSIDFSPLVTSGTTLTIEPCTTILMAPGQTLQIEGTLIAMSTPECPITFTSDAEEPAPGDWQRVFFTTTAEPGEHTDGTYVSGSVLQHVRMLWGGAGSDPSSNDGAALEIQGNSAPLLVDVEVSDSAGDAIRSGANAVYMDDVHVNRCGGHGFYTKVLGTEVQIRDSSFNACGAGALIDGAQNYYGGASGTLVLRTTFDSNRGVGLLINNHLRAAARVEDSRFIDNSGIGLWLQDSDGDGAIVANNWFVGNDTGMFSNSPSSIRFNEHIVTGNVFADQRLGARIGNSGAYTHTGNTFVNNEQHYDAAIRSGSRNPYTFVLTGNLFQEHTADRPGVSYPQSSVDSEITTTTGNNFVGPATVPVFGVGFLAGSPVVVAENNYWDGATASEAGPMVLDFFEDTMWAVGDIDPVLTVPNTDAPVSSPTRAEAVRNGDDVTLTWDANPETDVVGYRVYYGQAERLWMLDGTEAAEGDSGLQVSTEVATLTGLDASLPWRFAVTAVDSEGNESWFAGPIFAQ